MLPEPSPLMLLWQWAPALLQGFGLNILMGPPKVLGSGRIMVPSLP